MKKSGIFLAFLFLVSAGWASAAEPLTGHDIAVLVDKADSSQDMRQTMLMVIERGSQRLLRKMVSFTKKYPPDQRSIIRFETPSDIRNTSYLTWSWDSPEQEDDMWVYLPSENLVRRISGGGKKGSFMRSDLANEDIEKRSVADDTQRVLREEKYHDQQCWVLEYLPISPDDTGYSKRIAWIRKDIHLPVYIEYYDKRGKLCKKAQYGGFEKIQNIWTTTRMLIASPRKGSRTLIQISDVSYNTGLADSVFEQSNLTR